MADYLISDHAREQMQRRQIPQEIVDNVVSLPGQVIDVHPGREVRQSLVAMGKSSRKFLIRIIVDTDRDTHEIVTVYRTSKISKYWRDDL